MAADEPGVETLTALLLERVRPAAKVARTEVDYRDGKARIVWLHQGFSIEELRAFARPYIDSAGISGR